MNRRSFLATTFAAAAAPALSAAPRRLNSTRVSAITDEIARSPEDAIAFAHQYGMKWLSLRNTPAPLGAKSKPYFSMPADEMQAAAKTFKDAGIGIAFLDTPFLKFGLPGTEPLRKTPEAPAAKERRIGSEKASFARIMDDLRQGIVASHGFECKNLRIFTFNRIAEPESVFQQIADVVGPMADLCAKDGIRLLIENEYSQNAGTTAETVKLLKMLPKNVGINWDSLNSLELGEKPWPDGYNLLKGIPGRVWNVHVKGKSLLDYPQHQDWKALLNAMEADKFPGFLELETHISGEGQIKASNDSMAEIMRLLEQHNKA